MKIPLCSGSNNKNHFVARNHILLNCGEQVLVLAEDVLQESLLELCDLAGLHLVEVTSDTSVDDCYLLLDGHGGCRVPGQS